MELNLIAILLGDFIGRKKTWLSEKLIKFRDIAKDKAAAIGKKRSPTDVKNRRDRFLLRFAQLKYSTYERYVFHSSHVTLIEHLIEREVYSPESKYSYRNIYDCQELSEFATGAQMGL